jgi:hypothetical protein
MEVIELDSIVLDRFYCTRKWIVGLQGKRLALVALVECFSLSNVEFTHSHVLNNKPIVSNAL